MWFVSRTPTELGQRHCKYARYVEYHAGPHGTGLRRRGLTVPLATGTGLHDGAELIADWIMEFQSKHHAMPPAQLPMEVIAWASIEAAARYEAKARARGFESDEGGSAAINNLILEQRTLIEAQIWVFGMLFLPAVLAQYRIIDSEREESIVLDCTCGLGESVSDWQIHYQRGCVGIVQQGRADWILEGWEDSVRGQLVYDEFKTKSSPNLPWEKAWEHSGQLLTNMEAASRRLGKKITAANIPVFFKGWRGRDRNDPPEAPKYQHSPLVYGYFDPGSPGFKQPDWQASYRYTDDYGKGHTLAKTYQKQAIWEEERPLVVPPNIRPEAGRVETWVLGYLTPRQWPETLKVLGPFPHPAHRVADALQSIAVEERDWREVVDMVRQDIAGGMPEAVAAAQHISRSWNCTHFDGTPCLAKAICFKDPGWEHPATMGGYEMRTPHHSSERTAHESVGVKFPDEDAELDEEIDY